MNTKILGIAGAALAAHTAQAQFQSVVFDGGYDSGVVRVLGDEPMTHHRKQAVYGPPHVQHLEEIYPNSEVVRILPSMQWNGYDITPMRSTTNVQLDFWFGDPFEDGYRVSYDISNNGSFDLLAENPIEGFRFIPMRFHCVGDRIIAYCSTYEASVDRFNKIAIMSADAESIRRGLPNPWTLHYVTNEYSTRSVKVGALWGMSDPVEYEGAYWSVVTDYESNFKNGGQCWLMKIAPDGVPERMVRLHMRNGQIREHFHNGAIVYDGNEYKVVWHIGDETRRLCFRSIPNLSSFDLNAEPDEGSGINGAYTTKLASDLNWGPVRVAAGPLEQGSFVSNSRWKNAFILGQDPLDESKLLYGSDLSAGLIERLSIDDSGIAVCETIFNPLAKTKKLEDSDTPTQFDVFYISKNQGVLVAPVTNELDDRSGAKEYTGIVQSDDGGQTWGWIFKGQKYSGVSLLSNGRVLIGSDNIQTTVRGIMPGERLDGYPAFIGYRPENIIGNASQQVIIGDGNGDAVDVGNQPERNLPSIVHQENVFQVRRAENGINSIVFEIVDQQLPQILLESSNLQISFWVRRLNPATMYDADRMQVENMFGLETPGANYGNPAYSYMPINQVCTEDWTRISASYKGHNLTGTFRDDPGDLRVRMKGMGLGTSANNSEYLFEAVNINYGRPPLPYQSIDQQGVSSLKLDNLSLSSSWSMLAVMQVPEECWDSWTGNQDDQWPLPIPLLALANEDDSVHIQLSADMASTASGGSGISLIPASFNWELTDSFSGFPDVQRDYPLHTIPMVVAISKDGIGPINYVIAGAQGAVKRSRNMPLELELDSIRFSNIQEDHALEMYVHKVQYSSEAYSAQDLSAYAAALSLPAPLCEADLNNDQSVNFFDVSLFLTAFNNQDPVADFTDDGVYNFFDVSAFLIAYNQGCQ